MNQQDDAPESEGPRPTGAVPVLLYHAVTDSPGSHIAPFSVSPSEFERQLDLLVDSGHRCITLGELVRQRAVAAERGDSIATSHARIAVLTFDDGFADFAEFALPAMLARGMPATLFVTTGWLEGAGPREPGPSDRMLSWSQLSDLVAEGVELGAHSHSHPHMDTLGTQTVVDELRRSKEGLEDVLGRAVKTFAYPHGYHGPRVRRLTERAGYSSAAAVRNIHSRTSDHPFSVSRLTVQRSTPTAVVRSWLDDPPGWDRRVAGGRERVQTRAWRAYRRSRALLQRRPGSDFR